MGKIDIHENYLATTTICTCIGVIMEMENKISIHHVDTTEFNPTVLCSIKDAETLLMKSLNKLQQLEPYPIFKNIILIGGVSSIGYIRLKDNINLLRERHRDMLSNNMLNQFINAIKLNFIGFNLSSKAANGKEKESDDDDDPNDYVFDCTIVFDRFNSSNMVVIFQYGGFEYQMASDRSDSLLLATYVINPAFDHIKSIISSNASRTRYFKEFMNHVEFYVKNSSNIYQAADNEDLKNELNNLLLRVELNSIWDEM